MHYVKSHNIYSYTQVVLINSMYRLIFFIGIVDQEKIEVGASRDIASRELQQKRLEKKIHQQTINETDSADVSWEELKSSLFLLLWKQRDTVQKRKSRPRSA